jgi:hypothetical protein
MDEGAFEEFKDKAREILDFFFTNVTQAYDTFNVMEFRTYFLGKIKNIALEHEVIFQKKLIHYLKKDYQIF